MASNDIANLPDNWEVFHPLGEASDQAKLCLGIGRLHAAMQGLVHHLDSANEPILPLVRMTSIDDHTIEGNLLLAVWNSLS